MSAPEIKAAGLNSLVTVLRTMVSGDAFDAFVAELPPACAALIRQPPLALSWISLEHAAPLFPLSFERLFDRDPAKMFELGRLQLRADMTGIYRIFLRIASPRIIGARTGEIYRMYTRECGTLRTVVDEPGHLELLVQDRSFASPALYHYLRGCVFGVFELTGVKRLVVTQIEGGGDSSRCQFRVTWA